MRRLNYSADEDLAKMTGSIFDFASRGHVVGGAIAKSYCDGDLATALVCAAGTRLRGAPLCLADDILLDRAAGPRRAEADAAAARGYSGHRRQLRRRRRQLYGLWPHGTRLIRRF